MNRGPRLYRPPLWQTSTPARILKTMRTLRHSVTRTGRRPKKERTRPFLATENKIRSVNQRPDGNGSRITEATGNPASVPAAATDEDATPLFSERESKDFFGQWDALQVGFIDEPRRAVEQADSLVAGAMKRLAEIFAEERAPARIAVGSRRQCLHRRPESRHAPVSLVLPAAAVGLAGTRRAEKSPARRFGRRRVPPKPVTFHCLVISLPGEKGR